MKAYKIIVPKPWQSKDGNLQLLEADSIISTDEDTESSTLDGFVANGWAIEVKTVEPEVTKPAPKAKAEKETDSLNAKKPSPRKKAAKKTL